MDADIRLKLSVVDQEKADRLDKKINDIKASLARLDSAMKSDVLEAIALGGEYDKLAAKLGRYQAQLADVTSKASTGFNVPGRRLLEFGQAFQDFQAAGFRGIVNQTDRLAQALGGGAGLAGVAIIAATAFEALRPTIERALEAMKTDDLTKFTGHLDQLSGRLKQLKDNENRTAADELELRRGTKDEDRLKAGEKALTDFEETVPSGAAGRGAAAREFLNSPEGQAAVKEIVRRRSIEAKPEIVARMEELAKLDQEIARERANPTVDSEGRVNPGVLEGALSRRTRLNDAINKARLDAESVARGDVGNLLREAGKGNLAPLIKELGGAGFGDLAERLGIATRDRTGPASPSDEERQRMTFRRQQRERMDLAGGPLTEFVGDEEIRSRVENRKSKELEELGLTFQKMGEEDKKAQDEVLNLRRRNNIEEASGRLKWLRTLQEREERPAQMFGDSLGFYNALLTAGTAKGDGLDKTNSYLEQQIKIAEQQLEALRNFPANLGP